MAEADAVVEAPTTVSFYGESLRLNPDVSEFAVLEFAEAAAAGEDADTMSGLAALLRLVKEIIHADDRARFTAIARRERATTESLTAILTGGTAESERPTQPLSDSSVGQGSIEPKSVSSSDAKGSGGFVGRPDLQMVAAMSA